MNMNMNVLYVLLIVTLTLLCLNALLTLSFDVWEKYEIYGDSSGCCECLDASGAVG